MEPKTTIRNIIISQYGSVRRYNEEFGKKYGKIAYLTMLNRINKPDSVTLGEMRKMCSLLDLSQFSNPYSLFLE